MPRQVENLSFDDLVQEILEKKIPEMKYAYHRDMAPISETCPECNGPMACIYDDLGMVEFYDNYAHICLNPRCDYRRHTSSHECNIGGRATTTDPECPFCKRSIDLTC